MSAATAAAPSFDYAKGRTHGQCLQCDYITPAAIPAVSTSDHTFWAKYRLFDGLCYKCCPPEAIEALRSNNDRCIKCGKSILNALYSTTEPADSHTAKHTLVKNVCYTCRHA